MCRHLAYLGPPIALADLIFTLPHSLARQSWAPRDMRGGGTINADGFGIGWFPAPGTAPVRYRRPTPIWSDPDLPALAAATHSGAVVAAVRSATVGMPVSVEAAAPFAEGRWLFSHNGVVAGWPGTVASIAAALPVTDLLTLPAPTDAALLWALVRHRLRSGAGLPAAIAGTVADVAAAAPGSRLNLLLTDGATVVATSYGHSLSVRAGAGLALISSEPLDDHPGWSAVPDRSLVIATSANLEVSPLPAETPLPAESLSTAETLLPAETRTS